jgi:hypothetical protein
MIAYIYDPGTGRYQVVETRCWVFARGLVLAVGIQGPSQLGGLGRRKLVVALAYGDGRCRGRAALGYTETFGARA